MKDVQQIVKEYLKANGYGGLGCEDCGCDIDDLITCGDNCSECEPRYKILNPDCEKCETKCEGYTDDDNKPPFCLSSVKPKPKKVVNN